jgi:hypothetical protein
MALALSAIPPSPAAADQVQFKADLKAYTEATFTLDDRIRTVETYENNPTALPIWAITVVKYGKTVNDSADKMRARLKAEASALYGNQDAAGSTRCTGDKAALDGPYGSHFGYTEFSNDYGRDLNDLYVARERLQTAQEKVSAKLADAILSSRPTAAFNDLLKGINAALKTIEPLYESMLARSNTLLQEKRVFENAVAGPECSPSARKETPTPTPTRTPSPKPNSKPTPTPTPTAKPSPTASHCPGAQIYFPGLGCRNNPG